MDAIKRKNLKAATITIGSCFALSQWHEPIINSVVLPAHAQTSVCNESDILGRWIFVVGGDQHFLVDLFEDGSAKASFSEGTWHLDGNMLTIDTTSYDFTGVLSLGCNTIEGKFLPSGESFVGDRGGCVYNCE